MAIPEGALVGEEIEVETEPSLTYQLDFENKRIAGFIDEKEAIRQAIAKILLTERFEFLIYSEDYGFEGQGFTNAPQLFVESELKRRITEALLQDDRIEDVDEFSFTFGNDSVLGEFVAITEFGDVEYTGEVNGVV
jgi:hypothetical protein